VLENISINAALVIMNGLQVESFEVVAWNALFKFDLDVVELGIRILVISEVNLNLEVIEPLVFLHVVHVVHIFYVLRLNV
jgi:hypothetical protein